MGLPSATGAELWGALLWGAWEPVSEGLELLPQAVSRARSMQEAMISAKSLFISKFLSCFLFLLNIQEPHSYMSNPFR